MKEHEIENILIAQNTTVNLLEKIHSRLGWIAFWLFLIALVVTDFPY